MFSPRHAVTTAAPIALLTLTLAACGGGSDHASQATSSATTSVSSSTTPAAPTTTSTSAPSTTSTTAAPAPAVTSTRIVQAAPTTTVRPAPAATRTVAAPRPAAPVATAAAPGTRCYTKHDPSNGHERYAVFSMKHASCEFATNVGIAAMNNMGTSNNYDVQAYSPATKKNYTMHCHFAGDTGVDCDGANDAEISIGLNTGF